MDLTALTELVKRVKWVSDATVTETLGEVWSALSVNRSSQRLITGSSSHSLRFRVKIPHDFGSFVN